MSDEDQAELTRSIVMSDNTVAKRIRSFVDDTSSSGWTDARRLMLEAADEIERLEMLLGVRQRKQRPPKPTPPPPPPKK